MIYYGFEMIHAFPIQYKSQIVISFVFFRKYTLSKRLNSSRELFFAPRSLSPGYSQSLAIKQKLIILNE